MVSSRTRTVTVDGAVYAYEHDPDWNVVRVSGPGGLSAFVPARELVAVQWPDDLREVAADELGGSVTDRDVAIWIRIAGAHLAAGADPAGADDDGDDGDDGFLDGAAGPAGSVWLVVGHDWEAGASRVVEAHRFEDDARETARALNWRGHPGAPPGGPSYAVVGVPLA